MAEFIDRRPSNPSRTPSFSTAASHTVSGKIRTLLLALWSYLWIDTFFQRRENHKTDHRWSGLGLFKEKMQAPTSSQRSIQRRSPAPDPGPPPTVPPRPISPGAGPQPRTSSSSAKSMQTGSGNRRQNVSISPDLADRSMSGLCHVGISNTSSPD